jgi:hypothetical protein
MTETQARARPIADPAALIDLLRQWIAQTVPAEASAWLAAEIERQSAGLDARRLGIALGLAGRKIGRRDLALPPAEIAVAAALRAGWQPQSWGTDDAARVALLLATHRGDDHAFAARLDQLCLTAEITEHVAYLKGFAIFPAPAALEARAREGVRSSAAPVFQAIACRNPYPFDHFDEAAWNQMVVKCVFVGAPIESVVGLHARRNPELLQMLRDFVAERHAAGRPLPEAVHRFIEGER